MEKNKPSKDQRLQAIREIIERCGKIDMNQLTERVSAKLGVNITDSIKRSIYRDLEKLVLSNEINEHIFDQSGVPVEDDKNIGRGGITKIWSLPGHENKISGAKLVDGSGGLIMVSNVLKNDVDLVPLKSVKEEGRIQVIFKQGTSLLAIRIQTEMLPATLILSRMKGGVDNSEFSILENEISSRLILLKVPVSTVSSYKKSELKGHLSIKIDSANDISVSDLGSTNGTTVYTFGESEASQLDELCSIIGDMTATKSWTAKGVNAKQVEIKTTSQFELPLMVEASDSFRFLVI